MNESKNTARHLIEARPNRRAWCPCHSSREKLFKVWAFRQMS